MQKLSFEDPVNKTLSPQMCDSLSRRIKTEIDEWCVKTYSSEHRDHLGASIIGEACFRRIWYSFRWCRSQLFDGRQLRLFNRGTREEERWIEWLRGIGFTVYDIDPNTGKQYRIFGAKMHYGGSSDAVGTTPYPELIGLNLLCEFKTHNAGSFKQLLEKGLVQSKPQHYAQMCSYGKAFGIQYGLYCASAKNDDDIYPFVVKLDPAYADDLTKKAEDIIFSTVPPPKISMQPEFFECKYCPHIGPCHFNEPLEKNCRSCRNALPIDNAEWFCTLYQQTIPKDFIPKGCDSWYSIV